MKLLKKRSVSIKTLGKSFRQSKSKVALRKSSRKSSKAVVPPAPVEAEKEKQVEETPTVDAVEAEPVKEDVQEEKASETNMSVSSKPPSPMSVSSEHNDEEEKIEEKAETEEEVAAPAEAAPEEPAEEAVKEEASAPAEMAPEGEVEAPEEEAPVEDAVESTEAEVEEDAAKSTEAEEEDAEEMEETFTEEDVSFEPNIEMIQKDEAVAIGFYTPPVEEEEEKDVDEDFMSRTLAIGAEIMEQYFSCLPACQDANAAQPSSELATGEVKKVVAPVVQEQPESTPELEDRNDSLAEENPAAELQQEIRV